MTNQDIASKYFNQVTFLKKRENTQKEYIRTITKIVDVFDTRDMLLTDVIECDLGIFTDYLEEKDYQPTTYNKMLSIYKGFMEFIYVQNINRAFDLSAFKARFKSKDVEDRDERGSEALVPKEYSELLEYVYNMKGNNVNSQKRKVITLVILLTGLRRTEASMLRKEDVNLEGMSISPSFTKGGHKRKIDLPLKKRAVDEIKKLYSFYDRVGIKGEYVFMTNGNKPIHETYVNTILNGKKGVLTKALRDDIISKRITTHGIRKSVAGKLASMGVADDLIAVLLGHKNVETTRTYYIKIDKDKSENTLRTAFGTF